MTSVDQVIRAYEEQMEAIEASLDQLATLLDQPAVAFLEKPWRPSELLDAVERLMGG